MSGYIGHTDHSWWEFLRARPEIREANFWRPGGGRRFKALKAGEPFFFRLKSPIDRIGGFGLFARHAALPIWRAWEVFGQANGVATEAELVERCERLARRSIGLGDVIGCVAVAECTLFGSDELVPVPATFNPQNLSGSLIDLDGDEGRVLWSECLARAERQGATDWAGEAGERARHGQPQMVLPRLGQGSFRLAVIDAYDGACSVTGEHSLPALEAAHIMPWSRGGAHEVKNGLLLRRDLHRLFDLGYVSPVRTEASWSARACAASSPTGALTTSSKGAGCCPLSTPLPRPTRSCSSGTPTRFSSPHEPVRPSVDAHPAADGESP